jgi:hypothetical protein
LVLRARKDSHGLDIQPGQRARRFQCRITLGNAASITPRVCCSPEQDRRVHVEHIAGHIGRTLEKRGLIERDMHNAWLSDFTEAGPLDLMARLAALVPPPRMHLTRFHGVFGIEIEGCARCGGKPAIIASIEEPEVIAKILAHLEKIAPGQYQAELPLGARAPPSQARLL